LTVAVANDPGFTGDVSEVNVNVRLGAGVGFGVGFGVGPGVAAGVGGLVGPGVGVAVKFAGDVCGPAEGATATSLAMPGEMPSVRVAPGAAAPRGAGVRALPIATSTAMMIVILWMRDAARQALTSQAMEPSLP
jgi:hypothetical protein